MAIEVDMIKLVTLVPAFSAPIISSIPDSTVASPEVLYRLSYDHSPQNIQKDRLPYLYWQGPFALDVGQAAIGSSGTKKATFQFHCVAPTMTAASSWTHDIDEALRAYFIAHPIVDLDSYRLVAAIYKDRYPVQNEDITNRSAEEFPMYRSILEYRFGYQIKNY